MFWKAGFALQPDAGGPSRAFRRVVRLAFGCSLVAGLAACAVQALQYAEPTDDQAAELVVSTNDPMALLFYRDAARCTDALQVRQPAVGSTSYRIQADREFALKFVYSTGNDHLWAACPEQIVSFCPEKATQYRLHYTRDRDTQDCHWMLTESDGGRETPVKAWEREHDPRFTSFAGEGSWCKPKTM